MSAVVTAPVAGFTGLVAGVGFVEGVARTDDERALSYFRRHGYRVERDDQVGMPDGDPSGSWTKAQLLAWAATNGVEVPAGARKDDLLAAVAEHLADDRQPGDADGPPSAPPAG